MKVKVPVDFVFDVGSLEEAKVRCNEFLLRAVTEFRIQYNVVDYEVPYGYGEEEVPDPRR